MALLVIVTTLTVAAVAAAGVDPGGVRTAVRGWISVRLPAGWYIRRGWLSDVVEPIPRLALASFPARLSRHTCECGMPNVRDFPRAGAFLFMWEYPDLSRRELSRFPRRMPSFLVAPSDSRQGTCQGPSDEFTFQDGGRGFQVGIYFGPAAGPEVRSRMLAAMDSLRVGQRPVGT